MEEDSTTATGNSGADDSNVTTGEESNAATEQQTPKTGDNLDTSTSTDENAADGDKPADDKTVEAPASPKYDEDLDEWAETTKRGKPETDRERDQLQEIRNQQREYSKTHGAKESTNALKDELKDVKPQKTDIDDDDGDPLERRQDAVEEQLREERTLRIQSEYFSEKEVSTEEATAMGTILKEMVDKADSDEEKSAEYAYWTNPKRLESWHQLAKARLATGNDTTAVADEAAQKERERIEREHQANGPARNASNVTSGEKTEDQKRLERFSNWD